MKSKKGVQKWVISSINDPIVKIMLKNSNMTKIQLETILIDFLSDNINGKSLIYEQKAKLRVSAVSRGSFNRTLRQARSNIIQSIFTVFLLGYLGILETNRLDPYLEIGNRLRNYRNSLGKMQTEGEIREHLRVVDILRRELEASLESLSRPTSLSKRM